MVAPVLSEIERALRAASGPLEEELIPKLRKKAAKAEYLENTLWRRWPSPSDWPGILTIDEAAAYLRTSSDYIRDATAAGRDGKAVLRHQDLPGKGGAKGKSMKRIRKTDLDAFAVVDSR